MQENNCLESSLNYDQCCVDLRSDNSDLNAWLYSLSSDCISCPYQAIGQISTGKNASVILDTSKSYKWAILNSTLPNTFPFGANRSNILCQLSPNLGQYGLYELGVDFSGCTLSTIKAPTNPYIPLLIAFAIVCGVLFGLSATRVSITFLRRKFRSKNGNQQETAIVTAKRRVRSIDAFRGLSMLMMIFVNDGAGGYPVLEHTVWNGLYVGDLIFPCFIWIMGFCVPISLYSQLSRKVSRSSISWGIIKRSFMLFLIGLSLNTLAGARLEKIRIFGVLQRFSIGYLAASLIFLFTTRRDRATIQSYGFRSVSDIVPLLPQWFLHIAIVGVHCGIIFGLPIPGCPSGYLGPGGLHLNGAYYNCTGGATGYVDKLVLGTKHILQQPTIAKAYKSGPFDPEGMLGCLTTIFQVFLGIQAGCVMIFHKGWKERVIRWLLWALVFGSIGSALHFTNVIPVNKNLWSLSFVLVTSSLALALLVAFYLLIDIAQVWRGGPFRIPGMNALVVYVGHQICYEMFPFHWKIGEMNTHSWLLAENLTSVVLWTIIAYILHHKRIYITL